MRVGLIALALAFGVSGTAAVGVGRETAGGLALGASLALLAITLRVRWRDAEQRVVQAPARKPFRASRNA